jgi:hypothetical protein
MNWNQISRLFAVSAVFAAGCATDPDPGAEATTTAPNQAAPATGPHCVVHVPTGQTSCFDSFTQAISAATNGRIADAPADARAALADDSFRTRINALADATPRTLDRAVRPRLTVVIAIQYEDAGFQGATLTSTADFGCDGNFGTIDFELAVMPSGWNDEISSFSAFSNCAEVLYENGGFGGAQTQLATELSYVGDALNDEASTIRWF